MAYDSFTSVQQKKKKKKKRNKYRKLTKDHFFCERRLTVRMNIVWTVVRVLRRGRILARGCEEAVRREEKEGRKKRWSEVAIDRRDRQWRARTRRFWRMEMSRHWRSSRRRWRTGTVWSAGSSTTTMARYQTGNYTRSPRRRTGSWSCPTRNRAAFTRSSTTLTCRAAGARAGHTGCSISPRSRPSWPPSASLGLV